MERAQSRISRALDRYDWLVAEHQKRFNAPPDFFTAGGGFATLPTQIYTMIKIAVTPEVNAVSTLLMLLTLVLIVIASKLSPSAIKGH